MRPEIRLNSSALAGLTGQNPYVKRGEALLSVWKSSDAEDYRDAHRRVGVETPEDKKRRIKTLYPQIDHLARTTKPSALATVMGSSMFMPDRGVSGGPGAITRKDLMEVARETSYTTHGIDREQVVLDRVNDLMGMSFRPDDTLYAKPIGTTLSGRPVVLQGRVDAVGNGRVLEIKTRARGLFMTLKPYERVQMESYLFLTGYDAGYLAEAYFPSKTSLDPDLNMIVVDRDEARMHETLDRALDMANLLDTLWTCPERQTSFLTTSNRDRWIDTYMAGASHPSTPMVDCTQDEKTMDKTNPATEMAE